MRIFQRLQLYNVTYLGVIIDDELNFKSPINLLETKVAHAVRMLSKVRNLFPQKTLKLLYNVLVHPILIYGVIILRATYSSYLLKLKTSPKQSYLNNFWHTLLRISQINIFYL